jgi:hypothetical protein
MAAAQTDTEWLKQKVFGNELVTVGDFDTAVRTFVTPYSRQKLEELSTMSIDAARDAQMILHGPKLSPITAQMLEILATGTHNRAVRPTGDLFTVSHGNRKATTLFYTNEHALFFGIIKHVGCPAWKAFNEGVTRHFKAAPVKHTTVVLFVQKWRNNQYKLLDPFIEPEKNVCNVRLVLVNTTPAK